MTIINQKSISGITSITFASAGDDLLTFHSNNGTERFRIDNSGNTKITAGIVTTLTVTGNGTVGGTLDVTGNGTVGGTLGVTGDVDVADKIVHTGDTDTAIRFPAADTVTVETGGSERFRVGSGGQIQIPVNATGATSGRLQLGASQQLTIFQDSANAYLANDDFIISNGAVDEVLARFRNGGAVDLNHNNSTKLATTSTGISVTGNIAVTSGNGIDFSATADGSGTTSSELLDDYEEGTWTPSFTGRTLSTAEGTYTRIGRQVLVRFVVATLNSSLGAADRSINGLPFTAANINQNGVAYIGDTSGVTYDSGYGNIYARVNAQGNGLQLLQKANDGSTHTTAPALGTGLILRGYAWFTV